MLRKKGQFSSRKYTRIRGKSRRSPLDSRSRFNFTNKDSPDYRYNYGTAFTQRQLDILEDRIPWEDVPFNQLTVIMRKAEGMGDVRAYEKARLFKEWKLQAEEYTPDLTKEQAQAILQQLTPWKIDWNKKIQ